MDVKFKIQRVFLFSFTILGVLMGISSCKENKIESIPSYVIKKDTMVHILAEIHLLESSMGIRIFDEKQIAYSRNKIKSKIYKKHGVSKERFFKSYDYYSQNSASLDTIYTDVISEISKLQAMQLKK
jgi:hypothetical protein